jgi:hypothetical protein
LDISVSTQVLLILFVKPNGVVNLLVYFLPAYDVMRCKPRSDTAGLQIGVEAVGEDLVFG